MLNRLTVQRCLGSLDADTVKGHGFSERATTFSEPTAGFSEPTAAFCKRYVSEAAI